MKVLVLKKRKEFIGVAQGFKVVTPTLILQAAQSLSRVGKLLDDNVCYLGYTATKKIGKAHKRNRTKRRLRAVAMPLFSKKAEPMIDYVLIGRYNTGNVDFAKLESDMAFALKKINQLLAPTEEKKDETIDDLLD